MARRFFFVSAGLLCLALTYHLGARSATAQGAALEAVQVETSEGGSAVVGRQLYILVGGSGFPAGPPIPGTARVTACCRNRVVLDNGETWLLANGSEWRLDGVFPAGATPAVQESFGSLKARYHYEREPQGVKPSTGR